MGRNYYFNCNLLERLVWGVTAYCSARSHEATAMPGAATSRLVHVIHPLGDEPLGGVINGRGEVAFGLGV